MPTVISQVDTSILLFIQNNLRSPLMTQACQYLSDYGVILMGIYLAIILLWEKRKLFPIASACIVSGFIGNYIKSWLKKTVMMPRPFLENPDLSPLKRPKDFSFPSGHTTLAFSVAFIVYRLLPKKYSIPVLCIAVLIAFSRLYMGVHTPTDILGGICVGYVAGLITEFLYKR